MPPENLYLVIRSDSYGRSGEVPGYDEKLVSVHTTLQDALKAKSELTTNFHDDDYYYRIQTSSYRLEKFEV